VPLIDPAALKALLAPVCGRFDVDSLDECDSTNSLLMRRAGDGAPSGTVLVADRQSAGRGRRGRSWVSTPESGLLFSVLWRFNRPLAELSGLSLAVGVAVVEALQSLGAHGVGVKWPNDVLYQDAKLAGILVELASDRRGAFAVIGIGLNLQKPVADLPQPVCGLDTLLGVLPERHCVLAQLLIALAAVLERFDSGGFAVLRARWQQHHAWQGQTVRLSGDGSAESVGRCLGADQDGALLVETPQGVRRFLSGEITLRR